MKLRRVQRYCRECGRRMGRRLALQQGRENDPRTGKRLWRWMWACDEALRGYGRLYLYGRPYHDAKPIRTSGARRRLEPKP